MMIKAAIEYMKLIFNIKNTLIINPNNDIYHLDLKEGLYDGSAPKWFKNDIKQSTPYVSIKNIVIIPATTLISPNATKIPAITNTIIDALKGSLSSPFPLDMNLLILADINELSIPRACKVLGATITEPNADEII